jgi:hypothetical protein
MRTWRGGRPGQSLVRPVAEGASGGGRLGRWRRAGGRRTARSSDEGKSVTEGGGVEVLASHQATWRVWLTTLLDG